MAKRKKPKKPTGKRRSFLDWIIYKGEKWLYDQERILEDSKTKSQIFNNMASVRVKRSQVALNTAKLRTVELQNQFLELNLINARKTPPALDVPNTPDVASVEINDNVYCFKCKTFYPATQVTCCGAPTIFLDNIQIGEINEK